MNFLISALQKQNLKNELTLKRLQEGLSPSEREITNQIQAHEKGHAFGEPYYRSLGLVPHSITNAKNWNDSFRRLGKDLAVLFQANVKMNDNFLAYQQKNHTEKTGLHADLNLLSMKFDRIREMIERNKGLQGFHESFKDFRHIQKDSTAEIDLKGRAVILPRTSESRRIRIDGSTVQVSSVSSFLQEEIYGDPLTLLNNFENEGLLQKYTVKDSQLFQLKIELKLPAEVQANTVSLGVSSPTPLHGMLYLSEDGKKFKETYKVSGDKILDWSFPTQTIKELKILFYKEEADGFQDGEYEHYFLLRSLALFAYAYEAEASFFSTPIAFSGPTDKVTLEAEDLIFTGTNILYSVGLEREDGKTQWHSVTNHEPLDLGLLEKEEKIVNRKNADYGQALGEGLYSIGNIPAKTSIDSIELYPGYQMWYAEKLSSIGGYNYAPTMESYDPKKIIEKTFRDVESYQFTLKSQELYVLTQYLTLPEDRVVTFPISQLSEANVSFQQVVFCNGTKTAQKNGNFTLSLRKGVNKVIVMLYLGSGPIQEDYTVTADLKINLRTLTDDVSAYPKMRYVNAVTLRDQTLLENYKYFTVADGQILVKHAPAITKEDYNDEMRYYLRYRYLNKESSFIRYENDEPYVRLLLRADLLSTNPALTPKVLSYRLSTE